MIIPILFPARGLSCIDNLIILWGIYSFTIAWFFTFSTKSRTNPVFFKPYQFISKNTSLGKSIISSMVSSYSDSITCESEGTMLIVIVLIIFYYWMVPFDSTIILKLSIWLYTSSIKYIKWSRMRLFGVVEGYPYFRTIRK